MSIKVNIKPNWSANILRGMNTGLLSMVTDIDRRSAILAPKDTRALVNSRLISVIGNMAYSLTYGSSRVPYARRRHFENKKNPQTLRYLEKAGISVMQGDIGKYFRGRI